MKLKYITVKTKRKSEKKFSESVVAKKKDKIDWQQTSQEQDQEQKRQWSFIFKYSDERNFESEHYSQLNSHFKYVNLYIQTLRIFCMQKSPLKTFLEKYKKSRFFLGCV